uniref:hypothetical protein n=2 Tax=Chroococcidiopsis sp. TS-821 TaxID=1378066 RepID=UPI001FEEBABE|nr:hypothetical protein [Chroococcidiopsis sp. TS-821]
MFLDQKMDQILGDKAYIEKFFRDFNFLTSCNFPALVHHSVTFFNKMPVEALHFIAKCDNGEAARDNFGFGLTRTGSLKENTVAMQSKELKQHSVREDFSEYVAHLQLHMTLQARNLVPNLNPKVIDSREHLLHQTQATIEKFISRQAIS